MSTNDTKYDIQYCKTFYENLIKLLKSWDYDISDIKMNVNKGNVNITFNNVLFFYFTLRKTRRSISVSDMYKKLLDHHNIPYTHRKSSSNICEMPYTDDFLSMHSDFIKALYDEIDISFSGETFSCCSRYMQCSDEKKCVSPFKDFYRYCKYRRNLEQGKIFYGKNSILKKDL